MPEHVRVGMVGTSWWADLMHLPSVKSHPRAKLVAICGRNRDRRAEMAAKYEIPHAYSNYREMIDQGNLDALVIVTPEDLHYPITMAALDAGLHVMCEKPLALNARHAKAMYEAAEAAGVVHMIMFPYRWTPYSQRLRTLIGEGYIGRCFHYSFRYLGEYGRLAQYEWRFDGDRANGIVGDLGSHAIDLARWLVGDVSKVSAHLGVYVDRPGPEGGPLNPGNDAAVMLLQFENGAQGVIQLSAVAHVADRGQQHQFVLHGEGGTLEVAVCFAGTEAGMVIRGARLDSDRFETLAVPDDLWGEVDRTDFLSSLVPSRFVTDSIGDRLFIDAILKDSPASPSFYEGWKAQEVVDAAIESHRSGTWVSL